MEQNGKRLMTLEDRQIATHRPPAADNGLRVATQTRSGCDSKENCDKLGGNWVQDKNGIYYCSGTYICKDSGTGDWD